MFQTAELFELHGFPWPKFPKVESLSIQNITYKEDCVEGDVVLKYNLDGEHEVQNHFKTKVNQDQEFKLGPIDAKFHVWIEGPKLWLGLKLCIASFCSPEAKTYVDLPR